MRGRDIQEIMETIFSDELLMEVARATGFTERERKMDIVRFLRAMIMTAASGEGGRFAAVFRNCVEQGVKDRMVRSAYYRRVDDTLEATLARLLDIALEFSRKEKVDLPEWMLDHAHDWHIVDSTEAKLIDSPALREAYPGKGEYAAVKISKRMSVGTGILWSHVLAPARTHDSKLLTIDESWTGIGLLADLAYVSLYNIVACTLNNTPFVFRLKENWKPKVMSISRGDVDGSFFPGTDLKTLLNDEVIRLNGKVIDAIVRIGPADSYAEARLIGVPIPDKGYNFYLTNLPRSVRPQQIADLYRVRWEIELSNKVDKSVLKLDEIEAKKITGVNSLVLASLISSVIIGLMVHRHRLQEKAAAGKSRVRTTAPMHPGRTGLMLATLAFQISSAMNDREKIKGKDWEWWADAIVHEGQDPNWRRSPSILDQLRGWKITPGRPQKARAMSVSSAK